MQEQKSMKGSRGFLSDQTDWIKEASRQEKTALVAAFGGYGVDAFDYMIYTFMIPNSYCGLGNDHDRGRGHRHRLADLIGYRGLGSGRAGRSVQDKSKSYSSPSCGSPCSPFSVASPTPRSNCFSRAPCRGSALGASGRSAPF